MSPHRRVAAFLESEAATSTNVPLQASTPLEAAPPVEPFPELLLAARKAIERARLQGAIPRYGSAQWLALPEFDWSRIASVFIAAECWRHEHRSDVIAARLRADLAERDLEVRRRIRESIWDVSAAADWKALSEKPTHKEFVRRRGEVYDELNGQYRSSARPSDYPGGSVVWETR